MTKPAENLSPSLIAFSSPSTFWCRQIMVAFRNDREEQVNEDGRDDGDNKNDENIAADDDDVPLHSLLGMAGE